MSIPKEKRAEIRQRVLGGASKSSIANEYNVQRSTVDRICIGLHGSPSVVLQADGKEQTYRENLNWALNAAGEFLRTDIRPTTCPNNSAWFLYTQAINEPKDFLTKISAVEKIDQGEDDRELRRSSKRTLAEIESFLEGFNATTDKEETTS